MRNPFTTERFPLATYVVQFLKNAVWSTLGWHNSATLLHQKPFSQYNPMDFGNYFSIYRVGVFVMAFFSPEDLEKSKQNFSARFQYAKAEFYKELTVDNEKELLRPIKETHPKVADVIKWMDFLARRVLALVWGLSNAAFAILCIPGIVIAGGSISVVLS